ncbi:hypothetical protein Y863_07185 [Campylobacter jejuni CVM 41905]|nr:hypothetical protein Y863_07185 [Campylobacter jejuni CVM 41905]
MDILEITESEYHNFDLTFSYFDLVSFINYNKYKVNDVKYFLFKNNKNRFIIFCVLTLALWKIWEQLV